MLDSGCSSTIITGSIIQKLCLNEDSMMQWHTQAGKVNTYLKVKIDCTSPEISVTKMVSWNFHADYSAKRRYDIILGRDILTELGLNIKFSGHVIEAYYRTFKESRAPMVDLGTYKFKYLDTGEITP